MTVPDGWILLPPGDAALTRRVKEAGNHWLVQEKKGRKVFSRGVWPPMMWLDAVLYDKKVWLLAGRKSDEPGAKGDSGGAWYSADAGKNWTHVPAPWPPTHADGLEATEVDGIVIASGNQVLMKTYRLGIARK